MTAKLTKKQDELIETVRQQGVLFVFKEKSPELIQSLDELIEVGELALYLECNNSKAYYVSKGRSEHAIQRWTEIIEKTGSAGVERLRKYICSLSLGRNFRETCEAFFEREGLTEFNNWAMEQLR